ncbi:MAG: hypothetical protein V3V33_06430 [Candidatus Lokiarchaeia archaeon]
MEEIHHEITNKKFSLLLSDGFKLFRKNYKKLLLTWFIFTLLYNLLNVFLLTDITYLYSNNAINKIVYLIIYYIITGLLGLIGVIRVCSISTYLFKDYSIINVNFKEEFKKAINYRLKYPIFIDIIFFILFGVIFDLIQDFIYETLFLSGISVFSLVFLSYFIFIPLTFISLILSTIYIFVRYTYNIKDIERPIYEARSFTKGFFWKIVGALVINFLILMIAFYLFMLISQFIMIIFFPDIFWSISGNYVQPRNYGLILLNNLIFDIPTILLGPLGACLITPLFAHQYLKRENKNLKEII